MDVNDRLVDFEKFKKTYPWVFNHIKFSEEEQLSAVQQNPFAIRFIDNPSEKIQLAAVKQNIDAIGYIKNPTEKVKELWADIKYQMDHPGEIKGLNMVKRDGLDIRWLDNPSEKIQLAAVQQNRNAIKHIKNPTEKVKQLAAKQ